MFRLKKSEMETKYDPKKVEEGKYEYWLKEGFFTSGDNTKIPYTIVIPPPNVTGKLHIGHACDTTLQDIIIRRKRMQGYDALWLPGMDHAGIATQAKVDAKLKTMGISRAMVFQYSALFDSLNVFDNISFALQERKDLRGKYTRKELEKIVAEKLELVGLSGIEEQFPSELSGGMQKRVSFARAIVTEPKIILYDEPTAGLDPISSTLIEDYIVRLKNETNAASIVVTHQMSTIRRTADSVLMLYNGHAVFEGTPEELMEQKTPYTKQFVTASIDGPMKMLG